MRRFVRKFRFFPVEKYNSWSVTCFQHVQSGLSRKQGCCNIKVRSAPRYIFSRKHYPYRGVDAPRILEETGTRIIIYRMIHYNAILYVFFRSSSLLLFWNVHVDPPKQTSLQDCAGSHETNWNLGTRDFFTREGCIFLQPTKRSAPENGHV